MLLVQGEVRETCAECEDKEEAGAEEVLLLSVSSGERSADEKMVEMMQMTSDGMPLVLRPWTVKQAQPWILAVHRRLPKVQGGMWAVRVLRDGDTVGAALVGHAARMLADQGVLCVLRVAVLEGQRNACSMLYGACSRAAKAMGAAGLVTYTHQDEPGTSLRASGWTYGGLTDGGEHNRPSRPRAPVLFPQPKHRWWAPWTSPAIMGRTLTVDHEVAGSRPARAAIQDEGRI